MLPPDDAKGTDDLEPNDLEPNEDIIERIDPDQEPLWLWTQTCQGEECPCRAALVVAANSREQLDAHVAIVRDIWDEVEDAQSYNARIPSDIVAFEVDIDSGEVSMPWSEDSTLSEAVSRVAKQIDGDLLDRLASQWYLGKDQEDAATVAVGMNEIRDFKPGQLLAWDEVHVGARADIYSLDDTHVEAIETYCVRPKCQCNDVHIQFYQLPQVDLAKLGPSESGQESTTEGDLEHECDEDDHVFIGSVSVIVEDPVKAKMMPSEGQAQRLERMFELYQSRYLSWAPRLAARAEQMAAFGERLHAHLEQQRRRPWVSTSRKRRGKKR